MSESQSTSRLPDGVYMGVNIPLVEGKTIPHPWIEVIDHGTSRVFEYGPQTGLGSPMVEKNPAYADSHDDAGALYRLEPPPGMSPAQFIDRAERIGAHLDSVLQNDAGAPGGSPGRTPYAPILGADCDTAVAATVMNLGGSRAQFDAMIGGAFGGGPYGTLFTTAGGASVAMTPGAFSQLERLNASTWNQVGPAPGIPEPDHGSMGYERLGRDSQGRWGPESPPRPAAGFEPRPAADPGARPVVPPTIAPPTASPSVPAPRTSAAALGPATGLDVAMADLTTPAGVGDGAAPRPTIDDVRRGVDALRESGVNVPNPRSLSDWRGQESAGTFVDLGNGRVAQHLGRGDYQLFDVQRDLAGVTPPIGEYATLSRDGRIDVPQRDLGLGRSFG